MEKTKLWDYIVIPLIILCLGVSIKTATADSGDFQFETDTVRYVISQNGLSKSLLQKETRQEWLINVHTPFAAVKKQGDVFFVSNLRGTGDLLRAEFGQSGVQADFRITIGHSYIVVQLIRIQGEGVEEVRLTQLRLAPLVNSGPLVAAQWNEKFIVSLMGLSDRVHSRMDENNLLVASVYPEFGMEGQKIAIIAVPTPKFLDTVQTVERDFQLPSPTLNGQWAKLSSDVKESYLFTDLTEANVDETIRYAISAGFKYILIYSETWSASLGSYPINRRNFPQGEASLKAVIDKCHDAGLKVGMHMLTSLVGKSDPLVHPVPDLGLLKDAEGILAADLSVNTQDIIAISGLVDFPRQQAFYGMAKAGLDIQIDDEIINYSTISGANSNVFLQCTRGYAGTKAVEHKSGAKIYHLAERYGSYLTDLRTPLKEKISERVAGLINRCGFDMIYFDGGEVNVANGPAWYWVGQQQMDIWKRVKRDLLVQGSGITPWTWHIFSRGTCDDFAAVATKEYLDSYKISYVRKIYTNSFLPVDLGWWGFMDYAPHHHVTMPDEVEFYAVRMLALDAPVSVETNLKALRANGRTDEMLNTLGEYERLRLQRAVPQSVRDRLRTGEWHMVRKGEKPEFLPVRYIAKRMDTPAEAWVKNEFGPQQFQFRLKAVPRLAEVGDRSNIVLYEARVKKFLKPAESATPMPGVLIDRVEFTKPAGNQTSAFMVGLRDETGKVTSGKPLDLKTHRALAVKLSVEGPAPEPGEACSVLNVQLESGGKTYRDHYIDLDFSGERTIIISEPNTERMLREFWPANANYSFKAAMYDFNYKNIVAINFRWMRQPAGKVVRCSISLVEALEETESSIKNPEISIGSTKIVIPTALKSGEYLEFLGEGPARVFNENGKELSKIEIKGIPTIKKGENKIGLYSEQAASAILTAILVGDPLKF